MSGPFKAPGANWVERHARYSLGVVLRGLPHSQQHLDANRLTLLHFALVSLDCLGQLSQLSEKQRNVIVGWVHGLQGSSAATSEIRRREKSPSGRRQRTYSFHREHSSNVGDACGRTGLDTPLPWRRSSPPYDAHLAMRYSALAVLRTLNADVSPPSCDEMLQGLRRLQRPEDGCFEAYQGGEHDMRFVYCAAAIVRLLPGIDKERRRTGAGAIDISLLTEYIARSQNYDGGIGLGPGQESHGGSTYCAVAALALLGLPVLARKGEVADDDIDPKHRCGVLNRRVVSWCVQRYNQGIQGRVNKPCDSCYSWWVGATLALLVEDDNSVTRDNACASPNGESGESGACVQHMVVAATVVDFVLACEKSATGGFGKFADERVPADPLHTMFSLGGLSLGGFSKLATMCPATAIRIDKLPNGPK